MEEKHQMRPHLTKECRLPRCFKEVEKVLRSVKSCQQNYKTILANSRLRGHIHKKVYSMTVNVLKYYSYIQKIIDKVQLLEKEQYLRREIASVLIYELIFGNGYLPGESKIVKTIQLHEKDIFHAHKVLQNKVESSLIIEINIPRYVRVHTLVTTVPYVIKDLASYGFHQVIYDNELSEENYFQLVKNLSKGSFLVDFHFKDLLVFEPHENLVSLDLYKNGHIFLQDKSSYIPVHVLNPQPGCAILDACAAPGMKTTHIAAKMKNKGILIACERDKSRFECLKGMLGRGSAKICKTLCKDFSLIDPSDQAYSTIEYILLDPSCSGSGMVNRMDEVTDTESSKNSERLMKLAGFQIILLKHALKFPAIKRVVYSTCSIHEEENEYVVHEALKAYSRTFKLVPAMPEWSHRGSEKFEFGKLCLRTDPKTHLTNGFFVAVFERINYDNYTEECQKEYQVCEGSSLKKQKRKFSKQKERCKEAAIEDYTEINVKYNSHIPHLSESNVLNQEISNESVNYEPEQSLEYAQQINKKQKKKKKNLNGCSYESNILNQEASNESVLKGSKLKEYSNVSFLENNQNASIQTEKDKPNHNDHHNKRNSPENIEITEQFTDITKLHKKKKKKEHFETEVLQSDEFNQERQIKQFTDIRKLHKKKKKKEHFETEVLQSDEFNQEKQIEQCTDITKLHKKKKKKEKHFETEVLQSDEFNREKQIEQFTEITKLHKKKKEKEHFETEILQSDEFNQEMQNMFFEQQYKISKQDDCNLQPDLENGTDVLFVSDTTSSHKRKKKKKEQLNVDCIQSCDSLKKNNISDSCAMNDYNRLHCSRKISVNNKISQEIVDLTLLHKKKKKKSKHKEFSVETDA